MPTQSKEDRLAAIQKRLEDIRSRSCKADVPPNSCETLGDLIKPVALTIRLDPVRYARLSEYASQYAPRRKFQAILVAALDAYLDQQEQEATTLNG